MEGIRQYLLSVIAAGVLCSILLKLMPKSGMVASIGKMVAGVFMTMSVAGPLLSLELGQLDGLADDIQLSASEAVQQGQDRSFQAMQDIIKNQTEAYILDKAADLNIQIAVEVTVSGDTLPVPTQAHIRGKVSPYAKKQLQNILSQDLGIAKENQIWT